MRSGYEESEVKVVANMLTHLKEVCNAQQFNLSRGLKEFPVERPPVEKKELRQLHQRGSFKAIAVKKLTRLERERAMEGLMLLQRKGSGEVKGRSAYNGKPTRKWITKA